MENYTVLIADDEQQIAGLMELFLIGDGVRVLKAGRGAEALDLLQKEEVHLAILDITMPDMSGLDLCCEIRKTMNLPIIMVGANHSEHDIISGLLNGADDYVVKPFNPVELAARVHAQIRRYTVLNQFRQAEEEPSVLECKGLAMNRENHSVLLDGEVIRLTPIEFDILYLLASHPGRVYSSDEIFRKVWNSDVYETNNTVMVHIRRLRGKLKEDSREEKIITTVWGVGYKIDL